MVRLVAYLSIGILISQFLCMARDATRIASDTSKRVERFQIQTFGVHNVLHDVAQKASVVIGVEAVLPEKESKTVLDFPGGTTAELLNMVVAQSPDYRWRQDGAVIHVSRKNAHVSLSDVVVSYPGAQQRTRLQMWMDLHERPEVKEWMKASNCRYGGEPFHAKNFKPHSGPISIEPGNLYSYRSNESDRPAYWLLAGFVVAQNMAQGMSECIKQEGL